MVRSLEIAHGTVKQIPSDKSRGVSQLGGLRCGGNFGYLYANIAGLGTTLLHPFLSSNLATTQLDIFNYFQFHSGKLSPCLSPSPINLFTLQISIPILQEEELFIFVTMLAAGSELSVLSLLVFTDSENHLISPLSSSLVNIDRILLLLSLLCLCKSLPVRTSDLVNIPPGLLLDKEI